MKLKIYTIMLSVLFLTVIFCDSQAQFQLVIRGTGSDIALSIIQTVDGGYAVVGINGSYAAEFVKMNNNGTIQWDKTFSRGSGTSIKQTADGGYIFGGFTGYSGLGDFYIVKLDAGGNIEWIKAIGGATYDYCLSVVQTIDGGYAAAGYTNSFGAGNEDFYIVKLDGAGTLQWSKTIGGNNEDYFTSFIQTTDGGFALAGNSNSFGAGYADFYIVKLDGSGTLQWSRTVGGAGGDNPSSILQTFDGGLVIAGYTSSFGAGLWDFYIVKLDISGVLLWTRTIGGTNNDLAYSITKTTNGGFAVTGNTNSFGANSFDFYIVKLDYLGLVQVSKKVGGARDEDARSIIQTFDRGYIVVGGSKSFFLQSEENNFYIVKFDSLWNTCGNSTTVSSIVGTGGTLGTPVSIITSPTTIVTSPTSSIGTGGVVTQLCNTEIQSISNEIPVSYELYQNYPNPFNPTTKITFDLNTSSNTVLKVYDARGDVIETLVNEKLAAGKYEIVWNAVNYPSGIYFYKLESGNFISTKKMILIK